MDGYEINANTLAIIPIDNKKSKVIERDSTFLVDMNSMNIIERSCEFFGSTYNGRHLATKFLTGITHKSPIIIEESRNIIYFPTSSPRLDSCIWLSLNHIKNYKDNNGKSIITFENGENIEIDISYGSFENQFLRATRLDSVLRKRKCF